VYFAFRYRSIHHVAVGPRDAVADADPRPHFSPASILTSNSETNQHMIAINEALGYRVLGKPVRSWELPATKASGSSGPARR